MLHHSVARRALLSLVTAALVLGAMPGLTVSATGPVRIAAREVSVALERERVVELPIEASHVALHWRGQHEAALTVAFSADGVAFGQATPVEHDEVGEQRRNGETYGAVMHSPQARFVRVRSDRPVGRLTVLALDSEGMRGSSLGFTGATAAAAVTQPTVIARAAWGADESLRFDAAGKEKWIPAFYPVQKLVVHHTAGRNADPDPAATIRSIYYYHAITQGWGDIGYNFLVDESGRIYEGRYSRPYATGASPTGEDVNGNGVTAAHAQGYNSGTVGVALLGTLTNVDAAAAARDSLERMLAWKAERHRIDPLGSSMYTNPVNGSQRTFANISGHRDLVATECPGATFYATLPALRRAVAARTVPTPTPTPTPVATPTPTASASATPAPSPTPVASPPSAPLSPAAVPHKSRGIVLTWSAPSSNGGSPVTSYRISRSTSPGAQVFLVAVGTVLSYRDTATARGVRYHYVIEAVNAVGQSPRSIEATAVAK